MGDLPEQQTNSTALPLVPLQEQYLSAAQYPIAYPPPQLYPAGSVPGENECSPVHANPYYALNELGFSPQVSFCPDCQHTDLTMVERTFSLTGWLTCALLFLTFLVLWFLPLCCVPCCVPDCYNVKHYCSNCKYFLGERRR